MLAIASLVAFPILLIVALAVRFAGNARVLNFVNYSQIADAPDLHRWAGNRLLLLSLVSLALGLLSFHIPALAIPFSLALVIAVIGIAVWLAIGSSKFQSGR